VTRRAKTVGEGHPIDVVDNIEAQRFLAEAQNEPLRRNHSSLRPGGLKPRARMADSTLAALSMFQRDPNVQAAGGTDVSVVNHGVTPTTRYSTLAEASEDNNLLNLGGSSIVAIASWRKRSAAARRSAGVFRSARRRGLPAPPPGGSTGGLRTVRPWRC